MNLPGDGDAGRACSDDAQSASTVESLSHLGIDHYDEQQIVSAFQDTNNPRPRG
jgi:hypothetical protein